MDKLQETAIKIDRLQRVIGSIQLHNAIKRIKKSNHFPKYYISGTKIKKFLEEVGIKVDASVMDRSYALTTWKNWKEVISDDIVKEMKYIKEFYDCDNFAFSFNVFSSMLYGLNSAPPTYGETNYGRHYFNIIITKDNGQLNAYLYEPGNGKYDKIEKGKDLQLGNMIYDPIKITLF